PDMLPVDTHIPQVVGIARGETVRTFIAFNAFVFVLQSVKIDREVLLLAEEARGRQMQIAAEGAAGGLIHRVSLRLNSADIRLTQKVAFEATDKVILCVSKAGFPRAYAEHADVVAADFARQLRARKDRNFLFVQQTDAAAEERHDIREAAAE